MARLFKNNIFKVIFLSALSLAISSCGKSFETMNVTEMGSNSDASTGSPDTPPTPPTQPTDPENPFEPLAWEKTVAGSVNWSNYMYEVIENETFTLIDGADDMATFCPKYAEATKKQKINFWGQLFAAVAKFESSWKPTMRFHESTMGTDPVTKQPVYSEGLMQLSYQDTQWEPRCEFNWAVDKNLPVQDPRKTILDPYKNLRCGLLIMERQIRKHHKIAIDSGVYWAVLKLNGKYKKITEISAITKSLSFCK